jgi:hypothetical protein
MLRVKAVDVIKKQAQPHTGNTHQTVIEINTGSSSQSIRIGFTDQRLTAYGGMALWSAFLRKRKVREQLRTLLPQTPTSPNAYNPTDVALGLMGGILSGADKLSRVAYLRNDPALAQVLGIEAVASQSTLSRFLNEFDAASSTGLNALHGWAASRLPSLSGGYTLDLDSWSLLHRDGHQEGICSGHTPIGLKPCHRPLIACLAEPKLVAGFWLRRGNAQCTEQAPEFVGQLLEGLPSHIRIGCVRADAGFYHEKVLKMLEQRQLNYVVAMRLYIKWQKYCRHNEAAWAPTEITGVDVQEIESTELGRRHVIIGQRIDDRPDAAGRELLCVPGYRFQALVTNLSASWSPLAIWRRYNGRCDSENRIKELGGQFGIKGFCCQKFAATQAVCHLAIWAYNLCVLLQRELGLLGKVELRTLRWRLFCRAGVWSWAQGRATLKLAVRGHEDRAWWLEIIEKLNNWLPPMNSNAVRWAKT